MAQNSAMTGGEIEKMIFFSPSVAYGASSLITGPAGPCRAQPGVSPALGAALREPWVAAFQTTIYIFGMFPILSQQIRNSKGNPAVEKKLDSGFLF